jgi:ABC-type uncharacterized transport system permease subunit
MGKKKSSTPLLLSLLGLGLLIVLTGYGVFLSFKIGGFALITVHGWVALGLAVVLTALLAGGLIALAFYSNSHGYDDQ